MTSSPESQDPRIINIASEEGETIAHVMSDEEQWAIKTAVAANRPLLVRGNRGLERPNSLTPRLSCSNARSSPSPSIPPPSLAI